MKVLLVSAEAVPFAKVGGLADVVGSLPQALREADVDARVIMPGYGFIPHEKYGIKRLFSFQQAHRKGVSDVDVYTCVHQGVPIYLLQGWPYFGDDTSVYTTWDWDVPRFIFFNQISMGLAWELRERLGWFPDVVHVHDWHTSLLPFLLAENAHVEPWNQVASVITIHNILYQGNSVGGFLWDWGIPGRHHPLLVQRGLTDNLLGIAIAYAEKVSTVSPTYAEEIHDPMAGYELATLIQARHEDTVGILNGIDTSLWNPATDTSLVSRFDSQNFTDSRAENKRHLQATSRLPIREDVPVIGIVSRLTWQKGFDLAIPALLRLLADTEVQLVMLGTGDPYFEDGFRHLAFNFQSKATVYLEFDAAMAQHIYAGCDLFLMPSHFEPCGIGQMIAMRYGALPVVRSTGGLADTVENYDNQDAETGTGFVFNDETSDAVLATLRWAIDTYYNRPKAWRRMQRRAMHKDLSWAQSAQDYAALYQQAIDKKRGSE